MENHLVDVDVINVQSPSKSGMGDQEQNFENENLDTSTDEWMDATDFATVQNPTEWDILLTRGSGLPSVKDLTRDSLFVKFDPLLQKREALKELQPKDELLTLKEEEDEEVNVKLETTFTFTLETETESDTLIDIVLNSSSKSGRGDEEKSFENGETTKLNGDELINGQQKEEDGDKEIKIDTTLTKDDLIESVLNISAKSGKGDEDTNLEDFENTAIKMTNGDQDETVLVQEDLNAVLLNGSGNGDESLENTETVNDEQWINATDFAAVQNPTEWDLLLTRGSGLPSVKDLTRDSLFVRFDPLVQKREPLKGKLLEVQTSEVHSLEVEDSDVQSLEGQAPDAQYLEVEASDVQSLEGQSPGAQYLEVEAAGAESFAVQALNAKSLVVQGSDTQSLEALLAQNEKENEDIKMETELAKEDLNETESLFAEVLINYESGKLYQRNFEQNQKVLTARIAQLESCLAQREEKYQYIEMKALEITEQMKKEQEARLKILNNENYKLKASLKMSELKVQNVENEIEHIAASNSNLQKLCDEMIQQC